MTSGTISGNNLVANSTGLTVVGGPIGEMQYSGNTVSENRASNNSVDGIHVGNINATVAGNSAGFMPVPPRPFLVGSTLPATSV